MVVAAAANLRLRVIPGAARDEVAGWHGEAVKVRCQAPALDGRANDAVIELLARLLGVRRGEVEIVRGEKSRDKFVCVHGITNEVAHARLGLLPREG